MAQPNLKLMISSRCDDTMLLDDAGNEISLSDARKSWKSMIEREIYLGRKLLTVWINEEEVADQGTDAWDECLKQAASCDMFISIFDGSAGWQDKRNPGIGICHAEFDAAFSQAPEKVRVIRLANAKPSPGADWAFFSALTKPNGFHSFVGKKDDRRVKQADLTKEIGKVARELLLRLAHAGAADLKQSGPNIGEALDWSRMNFQQRAQAIKSAITNALSNRPNAYSPNGTDITVVEIEKSKIAMVPHAIPAAFGVSAAKEMTGQPFLRDHDYVSELSRSDDVAGPVHIIGCSKSVTEAQAIALLGFPDATIVPGAFGVYVADNVQKIQMCLVTNCRDASSTVHGVQRMFEWLDRSGESKHLLRRAKSRRKIVNAVIAEMQ